MSDLTERLGQLFKNRPWYKLPRLLAMLKLVDIRNELRAKNLHDTEEPPFERKEVPADLDPRLARGTDHRRLLQRPAGSDDGCGRLPLRPQRAAPAHVSGHAPTC